MTRAGEAKQEKVATRLQEGKERIPPFVGEGHTENNRFSGGRQVTQP